jgi:peptidoglycan hydrolase-like protein with peptidoglycan-binding domain
VRNRRRPPVDLERGLIAATITRHPREFVGVVMATAATLAIFVNALFLQRGPHPAPIFATRPSVKLHAAVALPRAHPAADVGTRSQAQIVTEIQRELARRGFYQGAVDGIWGAKTDAAAREFAQAARLKIDPVPGAGMLHAITASTVKAAAAEPPSAAATPAPAPARKDPIAALIAPSKPVTVPSKPVIASPKRVLAIQHALADFGYGQIKPTGAIDGDTRAAIEKFERDRHMPVDGQISDSFLRELETMTGRPLE